MLDRSVKNIACFAAGLGVLTLTSLRHRLEGYRSPTAFEPSDFDLAAEHVRVIVGDYVNYATRYRPSMSFEGLDVLELGPGATLGTCVLLAGLGAQSYLAVDAFPLARSMPHVFYERLLATGLPAGIDATRVAAAISAMAAGRDAPIGYAVDPDFDIARAAGDRRFDVIVSNAAFEHFDNIESTIAAVSGLARPGALFIALIDFQTHSRFIREHDPNNIYRIPESLYKALHFDGQPNRCRPRDYVDALRRNGWVNPRVESVDVTDASYAAWSRDGLVEPFRDPAAQMEILTGVVMAERPRATG